MGITPRTAALAAALCLPALPAFAHDGHDHGHGHDHRAVTAGATLVTIEVRDGYRFITSNGLPDHDHGTYPNARNPNRLSAQRHRYRVPTEPVVAETPTAVGLSPFGVAVNGVPFDPGAAEFWNRDRRSGWQYEALSGAVDLGMDANNAHVQPTGAYHYHGLPTGLVQDRRASAEGGMVLLGWAADGFPIYAPLAHADPADTTSPLVAVRSSYRLKSGTRDGGPGGRHDGSFVQDWTYVEDAGDLDECNGRFGVTPEHPEGTYHYFITEDFPFIPRLLRGEPDPSFIRRGPPRGDRGPRRGPPPPGRRRGR